MILKIFVDEHEQDINVPEAEELFDLITRMNDDVFLGSD